MRLVIVRGEGFRMNPLLKSNRKLRHLNRNPRQFHLNDKNNENSQSLDYGAGVISSEKQFNHRNFYTKKPKNDYATEDDAKSNLTEEDDIISVIDYDNGNISMEQSVNNVSDGKRKISTSTIDQIINGTSRNSSMASPPLKVMRLDTSISQGDSKEMRDMNSGHSLSKIPPTERKKWPQKPCVLCRKYGVRNDTRYICVPCNAALCKEPCFSEHHSIK